MNGSAAIAESCAFLALGFRSDMRWRCPEFLRADSAAALQAEQQMIGESQALPSSSHLLRSS